MCLRYDTFEKPEARGAAERTMRAITRADGVGLRKLLLNKLVEVPVITPAGLYVGTAGKYDVDMHRITRVVERMTRAFYFIERGVPVPAGARLTVYRVEQIRDWNEAGYVKLRSAIAWAHEAPLKTLSRNVVSYRSRETEDGRASVWLLTFYECIPFVAVITIAHRVAA